ncbi:NAD-dependent epimerase/dehydratase family protein [Phormidium pseudopriestleyi FRX01]|uniref:NAD-dependent epimerase/dehydratase family protein n=1 Tax=Phormidium pseudopriestleyi FRX01 TaxID=1759528 RepID=A0ABS3FUQ6_9CYAN|nr:NAD(P)-dependent oxidoreductase [Phormidium pseudopriestleyi]MBO0350582.1 NAD-dependent epimerase/dehydratase family protein [Phormidium pseudopriestleyi FRX01]
MKKVLITGGRGFIGQHCLPLLLAKGYEVHAVSSQPVNQSNSKVYWHQANLLKPEEVSRLLSQIKPSHLLHFAWFAIPGKYWTALENFKWVEGSLNLLQEFAQSGGQRVVMAGTCAEYNWDYGYCSEKVTPLVPKTLYGVCKNSLQSMVDAFAQQTGISSAWGRIFFAYGPHEYGDRLVPSVIRSLLQRKTAPCSHGNQIRDFLYVQDVADAFVTLLESHVSGAINIASGQPVALKDIIYQIGEILNGSELIELGVLPTSTNDPPLLIGDMRRLRDELCWQPKFNLNQGLNEAVTWWEKQIEG